MKTLWFDKGVDHRSTGLKTSWCRKPLEMQIAVILSANRLRGDYWELIKPKYQTEYLEAAKKLIAKGAQVAGKGPQGGEKSPQCRRAP